MLEDTFGKITANFSRNFTLATFFWDFTEQRRVLLSNYLLSRVIRAFDIQL